MNRRPDVSGNDVNGRGEAARRRPRMVYWAPDPDDIPHGEMQRWFYKATPPDPRFADIRAWRQTIYDAIAEAPGIPAGVELLQQYGRAAKAAKDITG